MRRTHAHVIITHDLNAKTKSLLDMFRYGVDVHPEACAERLAPEGGTQPYGIGGGRKKARLCRPQTATTLLNKSNPSSGKSLSRGKSGLFPLAHLLRTTEE